MKKFLNVLPLVTSAVGAMALIAALGLTGCSVLAPKARRQYHYREYTGCLGPGYLYWPEHTA
jgi:hypothetical protein